MAVYALFWSALAASRDRLQSLDAMITYLSVQIAYSPELIKGSVLAIDAISCSNTFRGMNHIDLSEITYLFVVYLQPINPNIKCCLLFVIESEFGIRNERIQTKISEILARIQSFAADSLPQTATCHITNATEVLWTFGSPFINDSD
jgi:hypothetical protein